ncbi:hypothetical protein [Halorubrum sp. N11]|uniref:hypothetical protein n=1 Tax=Halorubrum sp. N11 TaxID=3402276 RepID=UPI003EBEA752
MQLEELKNRYDGRVFLIGSGPSIKQTPLEILRDEYTLAVNTVPDIFNETEWRPSFYVCVDDRIDENHFKEIMNLGIPRFFPKKFKNMFTSVTSSTYPGDSFFFNHSGIRESGNLDVSTYNVNYDSICSYQDVWSRDITNVVLGYNTVMYESVQILTYLGFDELCFVGTDLYDVFDEYLIFSEASDPSLYELQYNSWLKNGLEFIKNANRPFKSFCNALAYKLAIAEPFKIYPRLSNYAGRFNKNNYFSGEYSVDKIMTPNQNKRHIAAHELMKWVSNELNFDIYNATVGGNLEVYPRVNLQDVLNN